MKGYVLFISALRPIIEVKCQKRLPYYNIMPFYISIAEKKA